MAARTSEFGSMPLDSFSRSTSESGTSSPETLATEFFRACGARGPLEIMVQLPGEAAAESRKLDQPFVLIGRDPSADHVLDHPQVSRRHAYLQLVAGRVFCVDLQSRTGTFWNDVARPSGWVDLEHAIRIGPFAVRVRAVSDSESPRNVADEVMPLRSRPHPAVVSSHVALEFSSGSAEQRSWRMKPLLALVGKSPACKVQLVDATVWPFHCSLLRTPLGVWLIDLTGRAAVAVNENRVRCARLNDGDRLQIGRLHVGVHCDMPAAADTQPASSRAADVPGSGHYEDARLPEPAERLLEPTCSEHAPVAYSLPAVPSSQPVAATVWQPATAKNNVVPSHANRPLVQVRADSADSLLRAAVEQLAATQQQMADQYQQAMRMLVQMFTALHRDQMEVIREELDRLHQLTQELHALQRELVQQNQSPSERRAIASASAAAGFSVTTASSAGAAARGEPRDLAVARANRPEPLRLESDAAAAMASRPAAAVAAAGPSESAAPFGDAAVGAEFVLPHAAAIESVEAQTQPAAVAADLSTGHREARPLAAPTIESREQSLAAAAEAPQSTQPVEAQPVATWETGAGARPAACGEIDSPTRPSPLPDQSPEAIHAWLCQRIALIQEEQQSRWQKILNVVRSKLVGTTNLFS